MKIIFRRNLRLLASDRINILHHQRSISYPKQAQNKDLKEALINTFGNKIYDTAEKGDLHH